MSSTHIKIIFFLFISLVGYNLNAQIKADVDANDPRKSEEQIKIEDKFVTAKYLALIGKNDEAIKLLDSIRRIAKPSVAIHYELARLYLEKKEYNLVESQIKAANLIDQNNIAVRTFEVDFYKKIGDDAQTIKAWYQLISVQPKNGKHYDDFSNFLISRNKYSEAIKVLENKELVLGSSEKTNIRKAEAFDMAGKVDLAVAEIQKLVAKNPKDVNYLKLIVSILQSNDKSKDAVPYLQKILELDPHDSETKLALMVSQNKSVSSDDDFLAMLSPLLNNPQIDIDTKVKELMPLVVKHAETGDSLLGRSLITACEKIVSSHPNESKAHAIYGDVLMNARNTDAAIIQYEKAVSLHKTNFMIWEQLMSGLDITNNHARLNEVAEKAIEFFPNKAISYYYVAKASTANNNLKKANEYIGESSLIAANNTYIITLITALKGYIEFKSSNKDKAIELLNQSILMSGNKYGQAYQWLGDVYKSMNQLKQAEEMYLQAQKLGFKPNI
jgi:tetratricopeptide (TPR) repeat protein